jgi:phospholipase C
MTSAGISWGWFHEHYGQCGNGYIPQENPFQYFTSTHAAANVQDLANFYTDLANGTVPAVSYIAPDPNHNGHPGSGSFTNALNWLDGFVAQVQNSSTWPDCAIVVIWDESGGWYDHVNPPQVDAQGLGMRVPILVISPYAKKGYVSHVQMDHVSVLRFVHWNWELPALTPRESLSNNLTDLLQF